MSSGMHLQVILPHLLCTVVPLLVLGFSQCNSMHLTMVLCYRSSGCGDAGCLLCQYNPSRICKRNLKQKYLIDDHLRAKCNAGLRVEIVDETGQCIEEALPDVQLEVR